MPLARGFSPDDEITLRLLVRWWRASKNHPESREAFKRACPDVYRRLRRQGRI